MTDLTETQTDALWTVLSHSHEKPTANQLEKKHGVNRSVTDALERKGMVKREMDGGVTDTHRGLHTLARIKGWGKYGNR